ncbi:hypothetical protein [Methylobacterium aerolatum]|uniref:PLD phosphodiesterase domain-containing protein n=1 Tax=Methylobacterium aerolatum TaxID=418708 RepID=A0ABU0I0K1_9HYPH|nr:hypothetical protein [Methylobacterium aerolatum]MDQ0448128.1 hypothetical protein [Methylobacterium aerolatum]GJD34004.1 hypothetical protein FMGBMHLM_0900 [Methylobacterium aerolatum]
MIPLVSPYEVLCAGKWRAALFTTFSLSLSFFEAVPLHALRKAGAQDIGILADVVGYRASLAEAGVSDVGRTYDLVPLKVGGGCFHPKIMLLDGPDGLRATVGSGNLTFGGWGHNVEVMDLLVPAQAPDAFADLADFLEYLALYVEEGRIAVPEHPLIVGTMAEACRKAGRAGGDGRTRLIHSFDGSIATQLAAHSDALGGAEQVTIVSPFFGGVEAVQALSTALGCGRIRVAVTGKAPEFFDFAAARAVGLRAEPVRSDAFSSTALLHAKVIEVTCRRGRLLLGGSVNATRPALVTSGNVEASVLRIIDDRLTFGWSPTDARDPKEGIGGDLDPTGGPCLSARFDGGAIKGRLFERASPAGEWDARIISGAVHASLGPVSIGLDGSFEIKPGPALSIRNLIRSTQLIVARDAEEIRGWLVFDQILGAVRERGPVAEAMIRTLAGAEEPDDLAVILSFFVVNPGAFMEEDAGSPEIAGTGQRPSDRVTGTVDLSSLRPSSAFSEGLTPLGSLSGATAFERLLASMRRYVREAAPSSRVLPDASEIDDVVRSDAGGPGALPRWRIDEVVRALATFVQALPPGSADFRRHAVSLLDFILFASERSDDPEDLKAEHLRRWVGIARGAGMADGEPDVLDKAFVAVLIASVLSDPSQGGRVHSWLQAWCHGPVGSGWMEAVMPSPAGIRERRLDGEAGEDAWREAMHRTVATRTSWMVVHEIQRALAGVGPMPDLPAALKEEALILNRVASGKASPQRVIALAIRSDRPSCRCGLNLPVVGRERLREHRVSLTCCGLVLLDPVLE